MAKTEENNHKMDPSEDHRIVEKELALKFGQNLVLNAQVSGVGGSKTYVRQSKAIPDLLADPIGEMMTERLNNIGTVKSVGLEVANNEENEIVALGDVNFPEEYVYLLDLEALNEKNLKPIKHLWKTIMDRPLKTKNVINKEVALICLGWAQAKLDEKVAVMDYALLRYSHSNTAKGQHGGKVTVVALELTRNDKETKMAKLIRKGAVLKFMRLSNREILKVPWAKAKEVRNDYARVEICIYSPKSKANKEIIKLLELLDNEEVAVFESQPDFIPQSMLRSIERIRTGVLNGIINPDVECPEDNNDAFRAKFKRMLPTLKAYTGLNRHQSQCLYSICTASHLKSPFILHGPPGTGKTRVIASTVRCLLEMDPQIRILLTTPSNMAADILVLKLMEQFDGYSMNSNNVLRLRSIGNDYYGRNKILDPVSCLDTVGEIFRIPSTDEFEQFRVIVCTLGCSTHIVNRNIPPGFFTHIFLDEAGQAGESEIWIPLGGLATSDTSVIFCGDPKQLGPVFTLDLPKNVTQRFDSALVRYMSMPFYKYDDRYFCQLRRSFRCHESILSIASILFYDEKLRSGILYRHEPFLNWEALPKKGFPVFFVDVKDGEQFTESSNKSSYANTQEIKVTLAYIQKLLDDFEIDPADIGVISPYRFQTSLLSSKLEKQGISRKLTVDSVERFQGSERKVILMTTTRSQGLGFLGCDLRLNTSITRAMNLLIIIGNAETLYQHLSWMQFMDYCKEEGAFIEWTGQVPIFKNK